MSALVHPVSLDALGNAPKLTVSYTRRGGRLVSNISPKAGKNQEGDKLPKNGQRRVLKELKGFTVSTSTLGNISPLSRNTCSEQPFQALRFLYFFSRMN